MLQWLTIITHSFFWGEIAPITATNTRPITTATVILVACMNQNRNVHPAG
ncbi:MAG: hypothetical protein QW303_01825 [Nitrososphaerota archaeon]